MRVPTLHENWRGKKEKETRVAGGKLYLLVKNQFLAFRIRYIGNKF